MQDSTLENSKIRAKPPQTKTVSITDLQIFEKSENL